MNLNGLMIGAANSKELSTFYTKILSKDPDMVSGDWFAYKVGTGSLAIGPHSEIEGKNSQPARIMISFDAKEPKVEFDRIKDLGAKVIAEPYEISDENGSMVICTFEDPEGNYFQIMSEWEA